MSIIYSAFNKGQEIKRSYEAFVEGVLEKEEGMIEEPIARKETSIIEREVSETGKYALTYYRVMKQFPRFAHIELNLETGRTHQIRVHMSFIQHPLAGDDLYGAHWR